MYIPIIIITITIILRAVDTAGVNTLEYLYEDFTACSPSTMSKQHIIVQKYTLNLTDVHSYYHYYYYYYYDYY